MRFPAGTPPDEQCFVLARGKRFEDGTWNRAAVAADGSFRVPFHPDTKRGWLMLEGRYCWLLSGLRWEPEAPGPFELVPALGGRISGRLVLPEGASADEIERSVLLIAERPPDATDWDGAQRACGSP